MIFISFPIKKKKKILKRNNIFFYYLKKIKKILFNIK